MRAIDLRLVSLVLVVSCGLVASCGSAPVAAEAPSAAVGVGTESGLLAPESAATPRSPQSVIAAPPVDRFAPIAEAPWTGAFGRRAILVGRTIRVEGPEGLLKHIVVASADDLYDRSVETTTEGFLQVVQRAGDAVVRGQLDDWKLAADERIVVLERIAPGPVVITADGGAVWRDIDGHEHRADRIQLVGEIGKMEPVRPPSTDAGGAEADVQDERREADGGQGAGR